ncbi:sugar transferase, partial [Campylobacter jejuni]|nr:sugar transferase [Campylobacter jejuni]
DNWSYEFIDKFLNKENLSDEYLLLVYKLGKYDFLLQNFDYINKLSLFLGIDSKDLYDFMSLCLKQKSINENFLSGKYKTSYIGFLSSRLDIINYEDCQLFLKILNEVRNSQDLILQSFFLKNSIDFFYINSSNIFFRD